MTSRAGRALRPPVHIGEDDTWHHRPLFSEIVHRAHAAGLAGAGVFRGIEGLGASSRTHTARLLSPSEDLPVAAVAVDTGERARALLRRLDEPVDEGLVTPAEGEVVRYAGRTGGPEPDRTDPRGRNPW